MSIAQPDNFKHGPFTPRVAHLNGCRIVWRNRTIFVVLPREMWLDCDGCSCRYCSPTGEVASPAYWDTLALSLSEIEMGRDTTWMVHAPELHGKEPKRTED